MPMSRIGDANLRKMGDAHLPKDAQTPCVLRVDFVVEASFANLRKMHAKTSKDGNQKRFTNTSKRFCFVQRALV